MAITKNNVQPAISAEILDQMMAEVTAEVAEYLQKDVDSLRKAVDDEASADDESEGSSGPAGEPGESAPPMEAGAPDEASAGVPPPDGGMGAPDPMMDEGSAGPDAMGQDAGAIEPAPTVEALQGEYMKLDPEALKMHYMACKSALMASMGAGQPDAGMAPDAAPPAAMAPPAAGPGMEASAPPAFKAEAVPSGNELSSDEAANGGAVEKGKGFGKSETFAKDAEIASLKEQLKKNEEAVLELAIQLTKPLRKSVKGLSDLAFVPKTTAEDKKTKVDALSKTEIVTKLREKSRTEGLKKSDRDLINKYTCGVEGVTVKDIEHLLTE